MDGVTLAAVKELDRRSEEQDDRIERLERELNRRDAKSEDLERLIRRLAASMEARGGDDDDR